MEDNTKVIQLKPSTAQGSTPVEGTFTVIRTNFCAHANVEVDVDERELRCQRCNAKVDPFSYILSLANEESTHFFNLTQVLKDITRLRADKEKLEKEVNNLKAAKRRIA